jgi:hypothetical protein
VTIKARHFIAAGGAINTPRCCCDRNCPTRTSGWASAR